MWLLPNGFLCCNNLQTDAKRKTKTNCQMHGNENNYDKQCRGVKGKRQGKQNETHNWEPRGLEGDLREEQRMG